MDRPHGQADNRPLASVIVPVYEDWNRVPELLACLGQQTLDYALFEVLLIDNGSSDPASAAWIGQSTGCAVRRLDCATPGSYAARNHGIRAALGEVLVFTDADCRPEPHWLEAGLRAFRDAEGRGGESLVAGRVRMIRADTTRPRTATEHFDLMTGLPQMRYVRRGYATTANLFVGRDVFRAIGLFDETRYSGGDADLCWRARDAGFGLRYCPDAAIHHPARRELDDLIGKVHRIKGGQLGRGRPLARCAWILKSFMPPAHDWLRLAYAGGPGLSPRLRLCAVRARLWLAEMTATTRLLAGARARRR